MDSLRLLAAARAAAKAARNALFPEAALTRAARLEVYVRCEPLAEGRRVLDLLCGRGWGAAHLLAAGASAVVGLDGPRQVRRCRRRWRQPGLAFHPFDPAAPSADDLGDFDLAVCTRRGESLAPALDWIVERLAPLAQLVVAVPAGSSQAGHELLRRRFRHVAGARLRGRGESALRFVDVAPGSTMEAPDVLFEVLTASAPRRFQPSQPQRLHIGAGGQRLEGWVNVDIRPFPGVDVVADVTRGLDFADVDAVFAEHFLEHLAVDDALDFLASVHRMLSSTGRLRLSTPNLDWVWRTHYGLEAPADDKVRGALALNRAFHGWEHKFLWNRETLDLALRLTGFRELSWHRYGESTVEALRGLERHETYDDVEELPHVLIVEARRGESDAEGLAALRERLQREFLNHVAGY